MLPSPMPEIMADASMANPKCGERKGAGVAAPFPMAGLVGQRQDFIPLEIGKDVIRRRQRVLVFGRERLVIGLDQAVILADLVKTFPDRRTVGRTGTGRGGGAGCTGDTKADTGWTVMGKDLPNASSSA